MYRKTLAIIGIATSLSLVALGQAGAGIGSSTSGAAAKACEYVKATHISCTPIKALLTKEATRFIGREAYVVRVVAGDQRGWVLVSRVRDCASSACFKIDNSKWDKKQVVYDVSKM